MAYIYDKNKIKDELTLQNIFSLLQEWGGNPEYTPFGILSQTICHNPANEGSRKLYYYENSHLFKCYTGCDAYFDIFELYIKITSIQKHQELSLWDSICYIASRFGFTQQINSQSNKIEQLEDWEYIANYERIRELKPIINCSYANDLKEYDKTILAHFNYDVKITPWLKEGIKQEVLDCATIGYYPGGDQITIPHFDKFNRFIGLRGRTLCQEEADQFGKYRPLKVNGILYNHPLGMNLYNLNNSQNNIKSIKKAIVFEGEKSTLLYQTYFGFENDISVACCGSSISAYQIELLLAAGAEEIIIAFDRQFQKLGDSEFIHLTNNLQKLHSRYKNYALISFIFDKRMITNYKASPIDEGVDKFLKLFKDRINLS